MKHSILANVISLLLCVSAGAQTTRHITLDEAVQLSLTSSKSLRLSAARVAEAEASRKESLERRLPDVSIQATYMRLLNTDAEIKLKLGNNNSTGTGTGQTESGGSTATPQNVVYGLANVSLPVFAGFKVQSGIESAKFLAQASRLDAVKDRQEVILNTTAAYVNLYKAREAVRLVQQNLEGAQARVREFSSLEQNGLLPRNDLLKGELQQSNIELALLDAQNNLRITTINMNLMLGLTEETLLEPEEIFEASADSRTLNDWEALALSNRSDIQALGYRAQAAEQGIRYAKSDLYPSVALTAGYIGAYVENVLTVKDALNAGLGLRYSPSSFWKTGTKIAEARARLQQVQANEAMLGDVIRIQVAQAYEAYLLAAKKIDVYSKASEQAAENYRIINNKYKAQLASATDLLDADVARLGAQLNLSNSHADATLAYQRLLQAAGIISEARQANSSSK